MRAWHTVLDLLAYDVSPWGGLKSPLLCWLGAAAMIAFFAWQVMRLLVGVRLAIVPIGALSPQLMELAERLEATDLDRAYDSAYVDRRPTAAAQPEPESADFDRLRQLDQSMREVETFRRPWRQYRKTLLIERVPWFKEPRVFSTRRAEEFFTPEAMVGGRIDLGFMTQVPALITGFGLLLTFIAICVGLSRLHAEGQSIAGIPGLINGLSGKFLTSIVGLICANAFVFAERLAMRPLYDRHAEFVALLDESFPRRTAEDLLDELRRAEGRGRDMRDALTGVVQALESNQAGVQAQIAALVEHLGGVVQPPPATSRGARTEIRWDDRPGVARRAG